MKPKTDRRCSLCWNCTGTQRESHGKVQTRRCRISGLRVRVTGLVGGCGYFLPMPTVLTVAEKANEDATYRMHASIREEDGK